MMDPVLLAPLIEWGVPGVMIIALTYGLWKRNEKCDEIMEKRIEEARETISAINSNTTALNALADLVKATRGVV